MIKISFEVVEQPPRLIVTEFMPYPLATVWVAETEGLYVQQWWAPTGYENVELDLTSVPGGSWRIVQRDPQGNHFSFYGRVEQVEPEAKLVLSLTSEVFPDVTILVTQEFVARDGGTLVASTYAFDTEDDLAGYLALGGMDRLRGASARLDALLAQLKA